VAIVIAAECGRIFYSRLKIPTGSMQPTLYGIVGTPTSTTLAQSPLAGCAARLARLSLPRSYRQKRAI
jgi:hypothetical protein